MKVVQQIQFTVYTPAYTIHPLTIEMNVTDYLMTIFIWETLHTGIHLKASGYKLSAQPPMQIQPAQPPSPNITVPQQDSVCYNTQRKLRNGLEKNWQRAKGIHLA